MSWSLIANNLKRTCQILLDNPGDIVGVPTNYGTGMIAKTADESVTFVLNYNGVWVPSVEVDTSSIAPEDAKWSLIGKDFEKRCEILIDSEDDLANIPDKYHPGTIAKMTDSSGYYCLNNSKGWVKIVGGDSGGSGLPEVEGSGNALVSVNGEWKEQDGYGYEDVEEVSITWNGDITGRDRSGELGYKVSDIVFTKDDVIGATITVNDSEEGEQTITIKDEDVSAITVSWGTVIFICIQEGEGYALVSCVPDDLEPEPGAVIEKGTYFMGDYADETQTPIWYVSSLSPVKVSITKKIDPKYIGEGQYGYETTETLDVTWDGTYESAIDILETAVLVYQGDINPEALVGTTITRIIETEVFTDVITNETLQELTNGMYGIMLSGTDYLSAFVITEVPSIEGVSANGIYFWYSDNGEGITKYTSSITGINSTTIHKIDEKYIPAQSGLPEVEGSGKALVSVNGEWVEQDGYGYTTPILSIPWDGSIEGRDVLHEFFYRVLDYMPFRPRDLDRFIGATIKLTYPEGVYKITEMREGEDGWYLVSDAPGYEAVAFITYDSSTEGVYFFRSYDGYEDHITEFYVEDVHKIDEKYLPEQSGDGVFIVNFEDDGSGGYVADKPFSDILNAFPNVQGVYNDELVYHVQVNDGDDAIIFVSLVANSTILYVRQITIYPDDSIEYLEKGVSLS